MSQEKFDVFVGNLTFNTTEEQLREKFSFVGPVKNVRMLTDKETGKPKGFAFVEYYDTNTALSAIRHLDQTELNSRKLKVGYPSQSKLKDAARQIGQIAPESSADLPTASTDGSRSNNNNNNSGGGGQLLSQQHQQQQQRGNAQQQYQQLMNSQYSQQVRQQMEQKAVDSLQLSEAWDVLNAFKQLVAEDSNKGHKAKAILEAHPQLLSALYSIQQRLGIVLPPHVQQQRQQQQNGDGAVASSGEQSHLPVDATTAALTNAEGGNAATSAAADQKQEHAAAATANNGSDIANQLQQLQQLQRQLMQQQQQQQMPPPSNYEQQQPYFAPPGRAPIWDAPPQYFDPMAYDYAQRQPPLPPMHQQQQQRRYESQAQYADVAARTYYGDDFGDNCGDAEQFPPPSSHYGPATATATTAATTTAAAAEATAAASGGRRTRFGSRAPQFEPLPPQQQEQFQQFYQQPQQQQQQQQYGDEDDDFDARMNAYLMNSGAGR